METQAFIFHNFDNSATRGRAIPDNCIRIYNQVGHRCVVINTVISELLKTLQNTKLQIREDPATGDTHLIFNKKIGLDLLANVGNLKNRPIKVNSIELVNLLMRLCKIESEVKVKDIFLTENLSNSDDYCTYKIQL